MTKDKNPRILMMVYLVALAVLGRMIFIAPNKRYLNILNVEDFYATSCLLVLICALLIYFFLKGSPSKKLLTLIVASIVIFTGFSIYYYANLPAYTYEEAIQKIEAAEKESGKAVQVQIPEHREDKLGVGKSSFLKMTHYTYYVYLSVDGEPVSYRFNPLDGQFQQSKREFDQ